MSGQAVSYTVRELYERGPDNLPNELVSSTHLIYSSPATLAFNSPGAEGFGVKREKAEFDDLARIARETGRSLREVRAEI